MRNKWVYPEPRPKPENTPFRDEGKLFDPFHGLDKKKPSKKSKQDRIAAKSVVLSERMRNK